MPYQNWMLFAPIRSNLQIPNVEGGRIFQRILSWLFRCALPTLVSFPVIVSPLLVLKVKFSSTLHSWNPGASKEGVLTLPW